MKKLLLTIIAITAINTAKADDFPYLTFETTDGLTVSIPVSNVSFSFNERELTVGDYTFELTNLKKMYFSKENNATGIKGTDAVRNNDNIEEMYDLQGHKIQIDQAQKGIYIVKTKNGNHKIVSR